MYTYIHIYIYIMCCYNTLYGIVCVVTTRYKYIYIYIYYLSCYKINKNKIK